MYISVLTKVRAVQEHLLQGTDSVTSITLPPLPLPTHTLHQGTKQPRISQRVAGPLLHLLGSSSAQITQAISNYLSRLRAEKVTHMYIYWIVIGLKSATTVVTATCIYVYIGLAMCTSFSNILGNIHTRVESHPTK